MDYFEILNTIKERVSDFANLAIDKSDYLKVHEEFKHLDCHWCYSLNNDRIDIQFWRGDLFTLSHGLTFVFLIHQERDKCESMLGDGTPINDDMIKAFIDDVYKIMINK